MVVALAALVFLAGAEAQSLDREDADSLARISKCWEARLTDLPFGHLKAADGKIFFASEGGMITAADAFTGETVWRAELGGAVASELVVHGNGIVIATNPRPDAASSVSTSTIRSLDRTSGLVTWSVGIPRSDAFFLHSTRRGVVVASSEGNVGLIDGATGLSIWSNRSDGKVSAAAVSGDRMLLLYTAGQRKSFALETGKAEFENRAKSAARVLTFTDASTVISGDDRGNLVASQLNKKRSLWKFRTGARLVSLLLVRDRLLAVSADNFIYSIAPASGRIVWKRRFSERIDLAAAATDKHILITSSGSSSIYVIDSGTGRLMNALGISGAAVAAPEFITQDQFVIATNAGLSAWSFGDCDKKK